MVNKLSEEEIFVLPCGMPQQAGLRSSLFGTPRIPSASPTEEKPRIDERVALFDTKPSPRTESLVASAVQWAEKIMLRLTGSLARESR